MYIMHNAIISIFTLIAKSIWDWELEKGLWEVSCFLLFVFVRFQMVDVVSIGVNYVSHFLDALQRKLHLTYHLTEFKEKMLVY